MGNSPTRLFRTCRTTTSGQSTFKETSCKDMQDVVFASFIDGWEAQPWPLPKGQGQLVLLTAGTSWGEGTRRPSHQSCDDCSVDKCFMIFQSSYIRLILDMPKPGTCCWLWLVTIPSKCWKLVLGGINRQNHPPFHNRYMYHETVLKAATVSI